MVTKDNINRIVRSIPFLIAMLFVLRLIGITNPPLEKSHSWRQCTGLMVARNFYENNSNILYPQIDETGDRIGVVGMEFPSLYYGHYLLSEVFGYTHWYSRLINLIISSLGLYFFARILISLRFSKRYAWLSTLVLGLSIWFTFSRKTMSDTYCCSLMFVAIFCAIRFLDSNKWYQLLLFVFLSAIAMLSKIPAGIYLAWLIPVLFVKGDKKSRIILSLSAIIPLVVTFWWYFIWNVNLATQFGNWYNNGKTFHEGFSEIATHLPQALKHFYFDALSGYIFTTISVMGFVIACKDKKKNLLWIGGLTFGIFIVYIIKSGFYFYHHNYYIIPFVPIMAMFCAYGLNKLNRKWIFSVLIIIGSVECIANQQHDFFTPKSEQYKLSLESMIDSISTHNELIAINGNGNPQLLYLAHRKGWNCSNEEIKDSTFIDEITQKGCRWIVIDKHQADGVTFITNPSVETEDFLVYKL